ncbi:hypothetical protein BCR36DRAFT_140005 [Piromyces finnis]|uniref:Uncharacterized protein n=1 Tax=Piromyces finnis TaxID=1754191 RepID=A0A1Y1UYX8_9FUNG|nr:hypothetical protein BCR36DRAFT_140005 [Piromyces finnis]|eukprot:ORX43744.1 hypothetical protein BCR36DRAFT_140005 [Piromyces finnis]
MTYTVAALKYDGKDVESDKKSRPDKKVSINEKQSGKSRSDACTSEGLPPQKDVLKTNVLDDFNNISKYNVELDDENVDKKRNDLNKEVLKKHESMITPSKELNELLENGPKSNYHPDPIFNNNEDEIKEVEDSDDDIDNERVEIEVINDDDDEVVEIDVVNDNDDIVEIDVTNNDNNDNDDNLYQ